MSSIVNVKFPAGCKPAESASQDAARPHLTGVWIDGNTAIATDSYQLAKIPVEVDTYGGAALEAPLWLPAEVVKDVTRGKGGGSINVTDEHYEPLTPHGGMKDYVFRRHPEHASYKMVQHEALWPKPDKTFEVGLNPSLLFALAKALGGYKHGVALRFSVKNLEDGVNNKPVGVRVLGHASEGHAGILMPVRLDP